LPEVPKEVTYPRPKWGLKYFNKFRLLRLTLYDRSLLIAVSHFDYILTLISFERSIKALLGHGILLHSRSSLFLHSVLPCVYFMSGRLPASTR